MCSGACSGSDFASNSKDSPFSRCANFSEKLTFFTLRETQYGKFRVLSKSDMPLKKRGPRFQTNKNYIYC